MTENQKRRLNDLLEERRQRELEPDAPADIASLAALIADDSYAMTFQSMGQYRTALLKTASAIESSAGAHAAVVGAEPNFDKLHGDIMNLRANVENCSLSGATADLSYKQGHRDARHAAAELVNAFAAAFDAAPAVPTQAEQAAAVRQQALEEAAQIAERCYIKSATLFELGHVAAREIRALAQSSTADKACEVRADPINKAYVSKLQTHALCLLDAATVYAFAYMQDEAEDEDDCVCGEEQHERAKAVFAAIKSLSRVMDAAPSTADSGNTGALGEGAD